jgi:hypothetical protein
VPAVRSWSCSSGVTRGGVKEEESGVQNRTANEREWTLIS